MIKQSFGNNKCGKMNLYYKLHRIFNECLSEATLKLQSLMTPMFLPAEKHSWICTSDELIAVWIMTCLHMEEITDHKHEGRPEAIKADEEGP